MGWWQRWSRLVLVPTFPVCCIDGRAEKTEEGLEGIGIVDTLDTLMTMHGDNVIGAHVGPNGGTSKRDQARTPVCGVQRATTPRL